MRKNKDSKIPAAKAHKRTGILLTIAGIAFLALGVWDYQDTKAFLATAKTTTGKVTHVRERVKTDKDEENIRQRQKTYYKASIDYVVDNKKYDMESSESTTNTFSVGETVTVYYNPENPDDAKISEGGGVNSKSLWIIGIALAALIGAIVYFILAKKAKEKNV